jgi:hypothetical protein
MIISTIVWCLIFINDYYNSPIEFPVKKGGQVVQAPLQVGIRSGHETNRFKIGLVRRLKRRHKTVFPLHVENGNKAFEFRKHVLPRRAGEILLHVNELFEQFGGKIHEL